MCGGSSESNGVCIIEESRNEAKKFFQGIFYLSEQWLPQWYIYHEQDSVVEVRLSDEGLEDVCRYASDELVIFLMGKIVGNKKKSYLR